MERFENEESRTILMESKWNFENMFFLFFFCLGKDLKMKEAGLYSWKVDETLKTSIIFWEKRFENEGSRTIFMESRWNFEDINHILGEKIWKWRKHDIDGKQMEFWKHQSFFWVKRFENEESMTILMESKWIFKTSMFFFVFFKEKIWKRKKQGYIDGK